MVFYWCRALVYAILTYRVQQVKFDTDQISRSNMSFIEHLHLRADTYREALDRGTYESTYLYQKLQSITQVKPWLSWDEQSPRSVYGLLTLDFYCKFRCLADYKKQERGGGSLRGNFKHSNAESQATLRARQNDDMCGVCMRPVSRISKIEAYWWSGLKKE